MKVRFVPQMGTGSKAPAWLPDYLFMKDCAVVTDSRMTLASPHFQVYFFFHLSVSSDKFTCSTGRAEVFISSDLSLKEIFFGVLMKDIVMENVIVQGSTNTFL